MNQDHSLSWYKYPCNQHDSQFTLKSSLQIHSKSKHTGIKYLCNQPRKQISSDAKSTECPECGKEFCKNGNMVAHYRSVHEGIKYLCNQCDYQATQKGDL